MNEDRLRRAHGRLFHRGHLAAGAFLALFVLLLYSRLLLTNRVLASGDILHYFYPYRAYAADAVRAMRLPLWNPFIFLGAPFLANPQSAVLYPLHWPLAWLTVTKQLYWSAAIHSWLFGFGGYLLMRRWGVRFAAALTTGLVLAGSGFFGGLIGHINQMNGATWLPWAVLVLEAGGQTSAHGRLGAPRGLSGRRDDFIRLIPSLLGFSLLVALMLLAGHTQTVYINLFGLGLWIIWPLVDPATVRAPWAAVQRVLPQLLLYVGGVLLGAALSAAQLWPTLELSNLGLRSGGLAYGEVSSFSLKPLHLLWTLLPSYGLADLSVVFDTLGYTEFVAYVGLLGLALGLWGVWRGRGRAHTFGLLFALLGLFLAAGRWNPFYYLLYRLVPGFDLFRAPARWMVLYTMGMAVLAGIGMDLVVARLARRRSRSSALHSSASRPRTVGPVAGLTVLLLTVLAADLLLAARALPHTHPTAPQAVYDVRSAPAHLLTDPARARLDPAAAGRFLSMSTITFDPGDMADYARILLEADPPQVDQAAFDELVVALKSQEILAPNLPLLWKVPAVDGFDGGVLPLQRYIRFLTLLIPPAQLVPDGRLREQITQMPDSALLALLNARYVITDKVRDLWFDGVYYDRQIGARLAADSSTTLLVPVPQPFEATHLDLIGYVDGVMPGTTVGDATLFGDLSGPPRPVLEVTLTTEDPAGAPITVAAPAVTAGPQPGAHFGDPGLGTSMAATSGAVVAFEDVENGRQAYRARLALPAPVTPTGLTLGLIDPSFGREALPVVVQAVTLFDARTGMFAPLLPSDRGDFALVHSGDVKIYENLDVLPRAFLVHDWLTVAEQSAALAALPGMDPSRQAVVESTDLPPLPAPPGTPATTDAARGELVEISAYAAEEVTVQVATKRAGLLVLSDTFYPGWQALIDDEPATIYPVNGLFRGVYLPAGDHAVIFRYQPDSWRLGLRISGGALALLLLLAGAVALERRFRAPVGL